MRNVLGFGRFSSGMYRPDKPTGLEVEIELVDAGSPTPDDSFEPLNPYKGHQRRNPLTQARIKAHEDVLRPRRWRPS